MSIRKRYIWIALAVLPCISACVRADVQVDLAEYRPDLTTDDTWSDGAVDIKTFFKEDYTPAGGIHVFLRNTSDKPIRIETPALNGKALDELIPAEVVWWRCFPNPVPAGGHAELYVRLRKALNAPAQLVARAGTGELKARIQSVDAARIDCIAFSHDLRRVYVYVRRPAGSDVRVVQVQMDGHEANAASYAPGFFHDVAPVVVTLDKPLQYGSVHYVRVGLSDGSACGALARAWDSFFSIGIFGSNHPDTYAAAGFNTYNSFGPLDGDALDRLEEVSMVGIPQGYVGGRNPEPADEDKARKWIDQIGGHHALLAYYLMDEPDVKDYYEKDIAAPLRIGISASEMERRRELAFRLDPSRLSFLLVDNTFKPGNWQVYGQLADLYDTDPYYYLKDNQYVRKVSRIARHACSPKPLLITTYISRFGGKRFPTPSEARRNVYYALGEGARGVNYYIHSGAGGEGGASENPVLWGAVARINTEVKQAAALLARATPVACATVNQPEAYQRALLCADRGLVIVLVNEASKGSREAFDEHLLQDVELKVDLPGWLNFGTPRVISPQGENELAWDVADGVATIRIPKLESGLLVLLPASPNDRPTPEVALQEAREAGASDDPRFVHSGTVFPHVYAESDGSVANPLGLARNAWVWEPESIGETTQMAWTFDVPAGQMQAGKWSIRPVIYSLPWVAYPSPEVELSVRTEGGLVLVRSAMALEGNVHRFDIPVEFSLAGRYVAVLSFRSRGMTRVVVSRSLYVIPTDWLQADPERDTPLARAGIDPKEWQQLTVSGRGAAYGMEGGLAGPAWNPRKEKYNYYEWYYDKGGESQHHISWSYDVPEGDAGRPHEAVLQVCPERGAKLRVLGLEDQVLLKKELPAGKTFRTERIRFTPRSAGTIRIELSHAGKGNKFAKATNCAYVRVAPAR